MVDAREQYIASQAPRKKRTHPARSAQALNTSGAGIVHRNMMDLQRQMTAPGYVNNQADLDQLKDLRRDWNRNRKYTGAGMNITGSSTPLEAQDAYVGMSRDLRQGNNPAYTNMYPISGNIMNYADKGGIWGALASEILGKKRKSTSKIGGKDSDNEGGFWSDLQQMGSDILGGIGIGGAVSPDEATEEVLKNYSDRTFGPINIHDDEFIDTESWTDDRKDVVIPPLDNDYGAFTSLHPFDDSRREAAIMAQYPGKAAVSPSLGSPNIHEDEPWPYEDEVIEETTQDGNLISDELWDSIRDFDPSTLGKPGNIHAGEDIIVPDWLTDPSLPMPDELTEGEYLPGQYHDKLIESPPRIPFDDSVREAGIATLYGKGPNWAKTGRRLEKEFMDYIQRTGDRITYDEFERAWERLHSLPRGLHYQEPRAGIR